MLKLENTRKYFLPKGNWIKRQFGIITQGLDIGSEVLII